MKQTLDQEWNKPTGTPGAEQARPENGAANGAKGANGSDVTPLFARAVHVESVPATPPLETSVRSEIQRVRLDLLARETERLQQKLQQILEERRNDREVIDALRSQIEDLTRQGLRMASRSENGEVSPGGDPELEKRIKPLLHTLLRMLERAKKDPRGAPQPSTEAAPLVQDGIRDEPSAPEGVTAEEGAGTGDDAWSQIDAAREEGKDEAKASEEKSEPQHEPTAAPWYEVDDSDDIPRIDEDFVEIAKLLRRPVPETEARAKKPEQPKAQSQNAKAAAAPPAIRGRAPDPSPAATSTPVPEISKIPAKAEPLLLGTDLTPKVEAKRKTAPANTTPTPKRSDAEPKKAPAAEAPTPRTAEPTPRAAEPGDARASRPLVRKARPALSSTSREVTLRRAAEIADRFGGPAKALEVTPDTGPDTSPDTSKVETSSAPAAEPAGAAKTPTIRDTLPIGKPEDQPKAEGKLQGKLEDKLSDKHKTVTPEVSRAAKPSAPSSDAQKRVEARASAIAARTAQRRKLRPELQPEPRPEPQPEPRPEPERSAPPAKAKAEEMGKALPPKSKEARKPNGLLSGLESDPLRAALPKCLTEPWDEGERHGLGGSGRGGSLRWPFRKSRSQKKGGKTGSDGVAAAKVSRRGAGED